MTELSCVIQPAFMMVLFHGQVGHFKLTGIDGKALKHNQQPQTIQSKPQTHTKI